MEQAPGLPPASKIIRDAMGFFQCSPKAFLRRNQMIKIKFFLFLSITFTQFSIIFRVETTTAIFQQIWPNR